MSSLRGAREIPQTPKIADCSRVSVMALATLCALKSPGATLYLSIVGEWCGKRLAANHGGLAEMMLRARSTEHGTEDSEAGHDMFRLTRHIAQHSYRHAASYRERSFMVTQNASYHVGPRAWPPRWHQNRLLSLGSAVGRGKMWSLWR